MGFFSSLFGSSSDDTADAKALARKQAQEVAQSNSRLWGVPLAKVQTKYEREARKRGFSEEGVLQYTNEFFDTYMEGSGQSERYSSWLENL